MITLQQYIIEQQSESIMLNEGFKDWLKKACISAAVFTACLSPQFAKAQNNNYENTKTVSTEVVLKHNKQNYTKEEISTMKRVADKLGIFYKDNEGRFIFRTKPQYERFANIAKNNFLELIHKIYPNSKIENVQGYRNNNNNLCYYEITIL